MYYRLTITQQRTVNYADGHVFKDEQSMDFCSGYLADLTDIVLHLEALMLDATPRYDAMSNSNTVITGMSYQITTIAGRLINVYETNNYTCRSCDETT